ncbi:MAG: archease [Planctomycetia bacterium]|jgi:SHS2 domain-containing protein
MPFETFEHTADLGLRITAPTLAELYAEAGVALFSVLVENFESIQPTEKHGFRIELEQDVSEEEQRADLMVDWLGELLFWFETQRWLFSRFKTRLKETCLEVEAWGEPFEMDRHELDLDIKAITYHGLSVREVDDHFQAEVIVDL